MKYMSLKEITEACGGVYHGDPSFLSQEAENIAIDSRKVEKGGLFIAVKGERVDGHSFIPKVMQNGALCALSEQDLGDTAFPYIKVDSSLQALKDIAEHYRTSLDIKVVGITGSVGKTSTKEMIASVLSQKFCVLKTEGNFNNEIGLPLTIFNIRENHQVAVLEMGISEFGEMTRLAKVAKPDICVITNIGYAHLENLGTRDGILKAKTEMFAHMNPKGQIFLNGDDDKLCGFVPENGISPVFFGLGASCPYHAEQIENLGLDGTTALFVTPASRFRAHISIPGDHMVYNALAGIAVGYALGMNDEEIAAGIEALVPIAGRNNLIRTDRYSVIDDCYNANPVSMRSSLDVLARADTRTVAVMGDMFELGTEEKEIHYQTGQYAAGTGINVLVCIGKLSAETARGARELLYKKQTSSNSSSDTSLPDTEVLYYKTKDDFFGDMDNVLRHGDTILIKASHGMGFAEIVERLTQK